MIPQKLVLEGVYSYRERQSIDFSTLSEAGIFGVFGNVGSGKSAILESMTYALYGQIERLNQSDGRGYNIMNLQSSSLFIDFEFLQKGELYRFTVSAKRQKKDFTQIGTPKRSAYRKEGGQWIPLPDEGIRGGITAEEIIGLSYEHFRKTVIIPQGKFQEFIQLPPAQRTAMIETLFGLQRFNLSSRCNILLARSREEFSFLEGRLQDLQGVKGEDLDELQKSAARMEDELSEKNRKKEVLTAGLTDLKELEKVRRSLKESSESLKQMDGRMDALVREEELLEKSRALEEEFAPLLDRRKELSVEEKALIAENENMSRSLNKTTEELSRGADVWLRLKEDQENYAFLTKTLESLYARRETEEIQKKLERDSLSLSTVKASLTKERSRLKELEDQAAGKRKSLKDLEASLDMSRDLAGIEQWYRRQDELIRQKNAAVQSISDLNEKNSREREKLKALMAPEILPDRAAEELRKIVLDLFTAREETLRQREQELSGRIGEAELKSELSRMAPLLKEGQPCPLCGSDHHPSPLAPPEGHEELDAEKEALKTEDESLRSRKERALQILPSLIFGEAEEKKFKTLLEEQKKEEESHLKEFRWAEFSAENREAFDRAREGAERVSSDLKACRLALEDVEKQIRLMEASSAEKEREKVRLETECGHLSQQIEKLKEKILPPETPAADDPGSEKKGYEDLSIESLETRLSAVDRDFQRIRALRREREETLADLQSELKSTALLLENKQRELESVGSRISSSLKTHNLESTEQLTAMLIPSEERKRRLERTESFRREREIQKQRCSSLEEEMKTLEEKTSGGSSMAETEESLRILEGELSELLAGSGALKEQIRDMSAKLELKASLSGDLDKQGARLENLKELQTLFKGGKFVQYIASVYMQELCAIANHRFSPLSGRSLEIVFQDNQIMVRDYLNEGRLRHIKTLSGGQSFQAALCLALALSEQTGRGKGSFFFLDEGFGSLDRSSLETVMSTLRELSREGRIIGLISHVEEMQQDLDVWLKIRQDSEKGSLISCSWEAGK